MTRQLTKFGQAIVAVAIVAALASCGGSEGSTPITPPPPSPPLSISSSTLPDSFYGESYSAGLQSAGGTGTKTWSISSGTLPRGLNIDSGTGTISGVLSEESVLFGSPVAFDVSVRDTSGAATRSFSLVVRARAPRFLTTALPDAVVGRAYRVRVAVTDPTALLTATGVLPPGIVVDSPQILRGTPATTGTFSFSLQLFTGQVVDQRNFTINVIGQGSTPRNDDIANARTVSSGTYSASISPLVDPPTGTVPAPDNDYYRLTAQPGSTVSIEIRAERDGSPLDSVIELVDSAGTRLNTCNSPGQSTFTNVCLNDDNQQEGTLDSKLIFRAPTGAPSTIFLHVVDWRGDGRPDQLYQFQILGAD